MDDEIERTYRDSWRLLVHRNKRYVSEHDAEDAVQDAFLAALEDGRSPGTRAWLTTVSTRRAIDEARRQAAERRSVAKLSGMCRQQDDSSDFVDALVDQAAAAQAVQSLAQLPDATQDVVRLVAEGQSTGEAAATLSMTTRSSESHLHRARRHARAQLVRAGAGGVAVFAAMLRRAKVASMSAAALLTVAGVVTFASTAPVAPKQAPPSQPAGTQSRPGASSHSAVTRRSKPPVPARVHQDAVPSSAPTFAPAPARSAVHPPQSPPVGGTTLAAVPLPSRTVTVTQENRDGPPDSDPVGGLLDCLQHQQISASNVGC